MDAIKKGKYSLIAIIVLVILIDIYNFSHMIGAYINSGYANTIKVMGIEAVKLFIHVMLLYSIYKGHQWARLTMIGLLLFLGISYFTGLLYGLAFEQTLYVIFLGVIYVFMAFILFFSKSVKEFMFYQRNGGNVSVMSESSE